MKSSVSSICILSDGYPSKGRPEFVFVKQLAEAFADKGIAVSVIASQSLTKCVVRRIPLLPRHQECVSLHGRRYHVYRPYSITFGNGKHFLYRIVSRYNQNEIDSCLDSIRPDVVYGHFWASAYRGYAYARKSNIPLFVATGESVIRFRKDNHDKQNFCDYVSGVVCVSSKNEIESITLGLTTDRKCMIALNAIDMGLFRKLDKNNCRKQLGIPQEAFVVIYVGAFTERKGVIRVTKALSQLGDKNIFSIFIGRGKLDPHCDNILFKGGASHEMLPLYLNASDIFVLPTRNEGCCNAIIEALACGLPVVSSDLPFNHDLLDESNSILIDPNNIDQIVCGIQALKDSREKRKKLADGALKSVRNLNIENRAEKILNFINVCINERY